MTRVRNSPGVFLVTTRSKNQLHPIGPPQVQVVADNLLKELASAQRPVKDLRQAYFHLPDREIPVVTGLAILRPERQRNAPQPPAEQPVNVLRRQ
jgi:hypothetical protein